MKNPIVRPLHFAAIPALLYATGALAQSEPATPKSIGHALLNSVVFSAVALVMVFVAFKVFDWATPKLDIQKELLNHNVAVAILTASVIIGVSIVVAVSIM
jgi:putative membrane protein